MHGGLDPTLSGLLGAIVLGLRHFHGAHVKGRRLHSRAGLTLPLGQDEALQGIEDELVGWLPLQELGDEKDREHLPMVQPRQHESQTAVVGSAEDLGVGRPVRAHQGEVHARVLYLHVVVVCALPKNLALGQRREVGFREIVFPLQEILELRLGHLGTTCRGDN